MRVFVTGATGFIGSAVIPELIKAGHQVLGLTRSEEGVEALGAIGAKAHRGTLEDLESLRSGAAQADGVIHLAFNHDAFTTSDMAKFAENCRADGRAIEALGDALAGSGRPLLVSGGLGAWAPGRPVTEEDNPPADSPMPRVSEPAGLAQIAKGVTAGVMRLPQVHNTLKQGLVTYLVAVARAKGVSAYVGDGLNRWPAAHVLDVGRLYHLALEELTDRQKAGTRYHAVAEEGVACRDIAEAIGRGLKVPVVSIAPEQAAAHFGFLGFFAGMDLSASSALTQQRLGWRPTGPGMIEDLDNMRYF